MSGCSYITRRGNRCRAQPLAGESWCGLHHPDNQARVAAGRKVGGSRRKRPTTLLEDVDFGDLAGVRRVLELAAVDAIALDPSAQRCRVLVAAAEAAGRLLQTADYEARLAELEALIASQIPGTRIRR